MEHALFIEGILCSKQILRYSAEISGNYIA